MAGKLALRRFDWEIQMQRWDRLLIDGALQARLPS